MTQHPWPPSGDDPAPWPEPSVDRSTPPPPPPPMAPPTPAVQDLASPEPWGSPPPPPPPSQQPQAPVDYSQPGYGQPGYLPQGHAPAAYGAPSHTPVTAYGGTPGWVVDPGAPFGRDPYTGEPLSSRSKVAAGLLQLFLGQLGIGRFYLGYTGIGLGQLGLFLGGIATSWLGIGLVALIGVGIWALIDAIMMFTGSVRDSRGYRLRG